MTTGFIKRATTFGAASLAVLLAAAPLVSAAADVSVVGVFNTKAVLVINGGKPRTLSVGESADGVKLLSVTGETAVVESEGKRQTVGMGQSTRIGPPTASSNGGGSGQAILTADSRGHFYTTGSINGASVRFMVDTGASSIGLSVDEARRLGLNYLSGTPGRVATANGTAMAYRLKCDSVRVGEITLNNVDCVVVDGAGLHVALLGMSFLNRTQMLRDGDTLKLVRRY